MALPTIAFNSSTGSDTAASGAGPGTALFGTGASTAASTVVTLLVDNPDLSGVATDGSAVIWIASSSGRQYSKITAVDNGVGVKTVTVALAYANTEGSRSWGIGGKRATLENVNSRTLFTSTDAQPGWIISIEDNQTITTAITVACAGTSAAGFIEIKSSVAATIRTITQSSNARHFLLTGNYLFFKDLKFDNTNATRTSICLGGNGGTPIVFNHCVVGDATNKINQGFARVAGAGVYAFTDCAFVSCTGVALADSASLTSVRILGCAFLNNTGVGVSAFRGRITNSLIYGGGSDGIATGTSDGCQILNCTIHGNAGDGIDMTAGIVMGSIFNNNITANAAGYGIRGTSGQSNIGIDYNNYGSGGTANATAALLNITAGAHDLNVDPAYVNAAGGNFAVGAAVQGKGLPIPAATIGAGVSSTQSNLALGASQPAASGGGAEPSFVFGG